MTAPLIGLTGLARSGKDTVAARLVRRHGFVRHAFADLMRDALLVLDPIVEGKYEAIRLSELVDDEGWEGAKRSPDVRRLLQRFGTDVGRRMLGEDVWVEGLARKIFGAGSDVPATVISDVRFENEAQWIRSRGGLIVHVHRRGAGLSGAAARHESELGIIFRRGDLRLDNDGTILDLYDLVDARLATLRWG